MHAHGHVRDAFWAALEWMREKETVSKAAFSEGLVDWVKENGSKETVHSLTGKLLHCTDVLPRSGQEIRDMGIVFGRNTYAAATRAILLEG